jgi:hypothetical protein
MEQHLALPEHAFGFLHKELVLPEFAEDESKVAQVLRSEFAENQDVIKEYQDETPMEWLQYPCSSVLQKWSTRL